MNFKRIGANWIFYQMSTIALVNALNAVGRYHFDISFDWRVLCAGSVAWVSFDVLVWSRSQASKALGQKPNISAFPVLGRSVPVSGSVFEFPSWSGGGGNVLTIPNDNAVVFERADAVLTYGDVRKFVKSWFRRQYRGATLGRRYWLDDLNMRRMDYDLMIDLLVSKGLLVGRGHTPGRLLYDYAEVMRCLGLQG